MQLTKDHLVKAATEARKKNANVWVVKTDINLGNAITLKDNVCIIIDDAKDSDEFLKKYNLDYNKNLLQVFTPDMILKYAYANVCGSSCSLDTFVDIVNNKVGQLVK